MAQSMETILIDTSILVDVLRGRRTFSILSTQKGMISPIVYMELIQGAHDKTEASKIQKLLKLYPVIHFNQDISELSISLMNMYAKSHGLKIPDAIIAATSLHLNYPLITLNQRDFRFIEDLHLVQILSNNET